MIKVLITLFILAGTSSIARAQIYSDPNGNVGKKKEIKVLPVRPQKEAPVLPQLQ